MFSQFFPFPGFILNLFFIIFCSLTPSPCVGSAEETERPDAGKPRLHMKTRCLKATAKLADRLLFHLVYEVVVLNLGICPVTDHCSPQPTAEVFAADPPLAWGRPFW